MKPINQLADLCGISSEYMDAAGQTVVIPPEYKATALEAMGLAVNTNSQIEKAIAQKLDAEWEELIPPAAVVHEGQAYRIPMRVPASRLNNTFKGELILENGKSLPIEVRADSLQEQERITLKGKELVQLELVLPESLPLGYHQLSLKNRALVGQCQLVVAPSACYEPESLMNGEKIWGSSLQLYTVRSENNWGMGDFSDLKQLAIELAEQGADIVGLNPIHSLYPANPLHCSPYSPSSRNYINPLYIDVTALHEYKHCQKIAKIISDDQFKEQLAQVRAAEYVDYELLAHLKYSVLDAAFHHFCSVDVKNKSARSKAFDRYRRSKGDSLERHATYEALFEHFKAQDINSWGWPCWPDEYRDPDSKEVKAFARKNKDRIRYYIFLQWLAETQLAEAQEVAFEAGMTVGIYRDLAVGVDRGGADVWSNRAFYCLGASVGAPPDPVAPQGQNWGLPPFNPAALKNAAYEPFIEMVCANMHHCGALRIDHVMGLLRLWWCPPEKTADFGVYVNYPMDDLLGIIKLESQRRECLIFGEDLGTVPPKIEATMPPARCYSNEVVLFSRENDRFIAPEDYKSRALTCISNHDIPTLKAWWNCNDLDLRLELGIYTEEHTQREKAARHGDKVALLRTLQDIGELPWGMNPDDMNTMGFCRELWEKIHYYLAKTASRIVVIQLEDVMELDTPVNVPGTSTEYPNWGRKLTQSINGVVYSEANKQFFSNFDLIRGSL